MITHLPARCSVLALLLLAYCALPGAARLDGLESYDDDDRASDRVLHDTASWNGTGTWQGPYGPIVDPFVEGLSELSRAIRFAWDEHDYDAVARFYAFELRHMCLTYTLDAGYTLASRSSPHDNDRLTTFSAHPSVFLRGLWTQTIDALSNGKGHRPTYLWIKLHAATAEIHFLERRHDESADWGFGLTLRKSKHGRIPHSEQCFF